MERTKYFNNTIPTETQLSWTESSRSRSILRRQDATAQMGIVSGFQITINSADSSKIDIAAGTAYTGGKFKQTEVTGDGIGERISTLTTSASGGSLSGSYIVQGLGLASYSNGESNYVVVKYTEEDTVPLSEVDYPFTQHKTIVSEKYTTEVYREADYSALTNEQKQTRILVGIVVARGAGVALSLADVTQVVQPRTHPIPLQPSSITGVTIETISDETTIGNATLRYEGSTKKLYWTAPGDTEGTGVAPTSSGNLEISSANTTYTLRLTIVYGNLPSADITETITIQTLYGSIIPRYSAVDSLHRDLQGTGIPTATNPHALSLNDITGGTFDHADDFHVNGISVDADTTQLATEIDTFNDRIVITNLGGSNNKFLIDGIDYETIANVAAGVSAYVEFDTTPNSASGEYLIYLNSAGAQSQVQISDTALWDTDIYLIDMQNNTAGNCTITWDSTTQTLSYQAATDVAAGSEVPVVLDSSGNPTGYYKLYSNTLDNWVIVRCVGALGGDNSTTFTTAMNNIDQPSERILRLALVNWDLVTETLSHLRDIREWATADVRLRIDEEHDTNGAHTIPLRNKLQGAVETGPAAYFRAVSDTGIEGSAGNVGVYGQAETTIGGGFVASDVGVSASATNTAVYAEAAATTAIYATAQRKAIVAEAASEYGIIVSASYYAVTAHASNYAHIATVSGTVLGTQYGVYVVCVNQAAAGTEVGVYVYNGGATQDIGVWAFNLSGTGIYGYQGGAVGTGVVGSAILMTAVGVAAIHDNTTGIGLSLEARMKFEHIEDTAANAEYASWIPIYDSNGDVRYIKLYTPT